jgi:hypothetical protein
MKYRIATPGAVVDLAAVTRALHAVDPAGIADFDRGGAALRVSTWASDAEVLGVLAAAGLPIAADQLERLPSECCGGCGG